MNLSEAGQTEIPKFLILRDAVRTGWWDALKTLCAPVKLPASSKSAYLFRNSPEDGFAPAGRPFSLSLLFHCAFILLLLHLPQILPAVAATEVTPAPQRIYYDIRLLDSSKTLPRVTQAGAGKRSAGNSPMRASQKGAVFSQDLAVVSKPLKPDNSRQTILQPDVPPDLRITADVTLPNIVVNRPVATLKMPFTTSPRDERPVQQRAQMMQKTAPTIPSATYSAAPEQAVPDAVNSDPRLPMPSFAVAKPVQAAARVETVDPSSVPVSRVEGDSDSLRSPNASPRIPMPPSAVAKPVQAIARTETVDPSSVPTSSRVESGAVSFDASNALPRIPIPSSAVAKPVQAAAKVQTVDPGSVPTSPRVESGAVSFGASNASPRIPMPSSAIPKPVQGSHAQVADGGGLIVMSVNPSAPVPQISLPLGNRQGEFTLSRPAEKTESSGGPNGSVLSGKAADGQGGKDEGTPVSTGILTVDSENGKAEASGALGPALPPNMVFPVHVTNNLRRNAMVVSTGPAGGGGLGVYGALDCGKIYTIFLPMPGKDWTMQYCSHADVPATSVSNGRSTVIHLSEGLLPPDPESRFDYRHMTVSEDKLHKMIVLKGILREDGTVGTLQIYKGVLPQMDEAARIAFGRWKFKPAMQGGKAVPVEILVGIPTEAPVPRKTH